VTGFVATAPATARPPGRPRKVRVKRARRALVVNWAAVRRAARYRVDVLKGGRGVARRGTTGLRLRFKRVPATRLRVEVRAISVSGAASRPRAVKVAPARR
jgi:hypothetical protein